MKQYKILYSLILKRLKFIILLNCSFWETGAAKSRSVPPALAKADGFEC